MRIGHLQIFAEIIFADRSMSEDSGMTRYGIEVSQSLIFAVGNESAKTMKIKRLENLALYSSWLWSRNSCTEQNDRMTE